MSEQLAQELRRIREISGSSLRAVEKATGISNAYLSQLEHGSAKNPSPKKLAKLAEFYQVPYEMLMELAGYLGNQVQEATPNKEAVFARGSGSSRKPSSLEIALMNAKLGEEEEKLVAEYVAFLSSRKK